MPRAPYKPPGAEHVASLPLVVVVLLAQQALVLDWHAIFPYISVSILRAIVLRSCVVHKLMVIPTALPVHLLNSASCRLTEDAISLGMHPARTPCASANALRLLTSVFWNHVWKTLHADNLELRCTCTCDVH